MSNQCDDTWTGKDKVWHFGVSLALAVVCPVVAVVAAVGKEVYDQRKSGGHWCWKDIVADAVGVALGTVVYFLIHLLVYNAHPPCDDCATGAILRCRSLLFVS